VRVRATVAAASVRLAEQDAVEPMASKGKCWRTRPTWVQGTAGVGGPSPSAAETREPGLMEKRVEYDVMYLENWSLSLDIKIIFLTVWNMIRGEKRAY